MKWNDHSRDIPEGSHAFLGASKYSWLNYTEEHLKKAYENHLAKQRGTELHAFAKDCIRLGQRLPVNKKTLNMYVNDGIKFKMTPEQPLKYSQFCYGTADSIVLTDDGLLRIHDLKTGRTPASMHQLEIYAALFCLEYNYIPGDLDYELRIYQNDEINVSNPGVEVIATTMDKIVTFDRCLFKIQEELSN